MLAGLASLVFIPLLSVSIVHFMWAFGSTFPVRSEEELAKLVVGTNGIKEMPAGWMSFLVALLAIFAGVWALALSDVNPNYVLTAGGIVASIIFLARGLISYLPMATKMNFEEPFATYDKKLYAPLCIYLGVGFTTLTSLHATPLAG